MIKKKKILLIDSKEKMLKKLQKLSKNTNINISYVNYGLKAIKKILLNDYDLYFIADEVDKLNLIKLIKEYKSKSKIIICAYNTNQKYEEYIRSYGITYLIREPFSEEELKLLLF